ncbi:GAF domain-containing protein [Candidatus Magnetominusculus xianensis]|uniref:GAF-domain-containing sensor protein n=1 Tax=Candidatus Magnetominusculus xianensis TaxID=1748249 RepID=A0ABR5SAW2_9BACT|nr:GAF domain-containing protein [Candidatus Magnetominusculus xianensis]KWT75003.1 GAF-domain-containing sensor protein [Candidatus Magnetominusculus xianensis]MBF0404934.1 GAF domain-containing protein [Nitrospirota bacterium]
MLATEKQLTLTCGWCKKIKNGDTWQTIEEFLNSLGYADITHGMCGECSEKIFQKRVYLESYQNICKAISSSIALDEVLNLIVTNIVRVMNVKACLLRLINKKSRTLDVAASFGLSDDYVNKGAVTFDQSLEDAMSGKPVSIYDVADDKNSIYFHAANKEGIRSIMSVPLRFKDDIIGIMRMYTAEPRNYSDEDMKFVSAIAEQAAMAIMNAKEFETIVSKEKEYLRVFQEISKALSSSLNLEEILNMIVRKIPEAIQVKGATIKLIDEKTKKIKLAASYGLNNDFLAKDPTGKELNIMEALNHLYSQASMLPFLKDKDMNILEELNYKPVFIYDATTDPRVLNKKDIIEEGIKSILSVPILARGKLIGVIKLFTGWLRNFTQKEVAFTTSLAEQCGLAIVNATMYEKQYKEVTYLKTLQEITKLRTKTTDFSQVLNRIVTRLPEIMNTKAATIRLLNPKTQRLELAAASGLSDEYLSRGSVEFEENIKTALKGEPVAIYDAASDARIHFNKEAQREGIKSILAIPLILYNDTIGVLRLLTSELRVFTSDEIDFAMALAEEAAIVIENARLQNKI